LAALDSFPSQTLLVGSLTTENAFPVLLRSVALGLSEETEWIIWFIGKNKVPISKEVHQTLFAVSLTCLYGFSRK
jgi:hypothetical protein